MSLPISSMLENFHEMFGLNPTRISGQTDGEPGLVEAQADSAPDALPQSVLLGDGLQREIRPDHDVHLDEAGTPGLDHVVHVADDVVLAADRLREKMPFRMTTSDSRKRP